MIIDGKSFAAELRGKVKTHVLELAKVDVRPGLAVVLVGNDPASTVYVRSKGKQTVDAGMESFEHHLEADVSEEHLLGLIDDLNRDPRVHGILVQLPLPPQISTFRVINSIAPEKDVDGFHVSNVGRVSTGQEALVPCTPLGCLMLLKASLGDLSGLDAVVLGRSNIVGKPMAQLLLSENCTVTVAHSKTKNLRDVCRRADIVVAAVGRPEFLRAEWIKPGATVIDVGINRVDVEGHSKLVGDVDFENAKLIAGAISPVPGGVGPMTIACLLLNTLTACCRANGLSEPSY